MRSTETLVEVRKLLRPNMHVDIAEKQVDIGGDAHTSELETA